MLIKFAFFFVFTFLFVPFCCVASGEFNCKPTGFGVSITTDKAIYTPGEKIKITLSAFNFTETSLKLTFTSSQRYDFFILHEGKKIWRWSEGKAFAQVMGEETLGPGKGLVYRETFDPQEKFAPGVYFITGVITSKDPAEAFSATVCVRIMHEPPHPEKK